VSTWEAALDEFERRIRYQRAALDLGEAGDLGPFQAPTGLGALPEHLAQRAESLLAQSLDVELELAGNVQSLAQDLAVVRTIDASTARPVQANFVDFSA
jgi:hypothetical protein